MSSPTTDDDRATAVTDARRDAPDAAPDGGAAVPRRRRVDKTLLLVSFVVAIGLTMVVRGVFVGVTGDDRASLPDQIEEIDPVADAERVVRQTQVFVDLAAGYTGRLVIDGQEIETVSIDAIGNDQIEPGQQIDVPPATIYEPGNATLTFRPSEGAPIEEFDEGLHEATVIFWRIEDGPSRARSYTWTFNTA